MDNEQNPDIKDEEQTEKTIIVEPKQAKNKSKVYIWIIAVLLIIIVVGAALFIVSSNKKKGNENTSAKDNSTSKQQNKSNNVWSQMEKGPYHDRVSFATGTSLTSWTKSGKIIAEHASVPDVIYKNGTLYIYFVDVSEDGKNEQIGLLKSSDNGNTWSNKQIINIKGVGDKIPVDPAPFLLADGRIRLYYFDIGTTRTGNSINTSDNKIYSALSDDGINFVEEQGVRFAKADIYDPDVIMDGKIWRMYVGTGSSQQVLSATSSDGLSFTYEGIALDKATIPNVILENNTYYLFTGGIEISTSMDGKTFTKTTNRFDSGGLTADPGVVKLGPNNYFMVFKTDDGTNRPANKPPQ